MFANFVLRYNFSVLRSIVLEPFSIGLCTRQDSTRLMTACPVSSCAHAFGVGATGIEVALFMLGLLFPHRDAMSCATDLEGGPETGLQYLDPIVFQTSDFWGGCAPCCRESSIWVGNRAPCSSACATSSIAVGSLSSFATAKLLRSTESRVGVGKIIVNSRLKR